MSRIAMVLRKKRQAFVAGAALLVLSFYAWQIAATWQNDENDAGLPGRPIANLHGYAVRLDPLTGTASSGEVTAILQANWRADTGVLLVHNLPILGPGEVYRMWGVDATGTVDAAAEFTVPFYGSSVFSVDVITAQLLHAYRRFFITVEPAGGHGPLPTGRQVLAS